MKLVNVYVNVNFCLIVYPFFFIKKKITTLSNLIISVFQNVRTHFFICAIIIVIIFFSGFYIQPSKLYLFAYFILLCIYFPRFFFEKKIISFSLICTREFWEYVNGQRKKLRKKENLNSLSSFLGFSRTCK